MFQDRGRQIRTERFRDAAMPLLAGGVIAIIELIEWLIPELPRPANLLVPVVAFAAFVRGLVPGLATAAVSAIWIAHEVISGEHTGFEREYCIIVGINCFVMACLCGVLRLRFDHLARRNSEEKAQHLEVVVQNLAELRQSEAALQAELAKSSSIRTALDLQLGMVRLTPDLRIIEVNPMFRDIYEAPGHDLAGMPAEQFSQNQRSLELIEEVRAALAEKRMWVGETQTRTLSGRAIWVCASVAPILDAHGEVVECVAFIRDITEQKASDDRLGQARLEIVMRLARATEYRDDDTGAHVHRLGVFARMIGEKVGMDGPDADLLLWATMLHDIGKLAIPDSILQKPGKLTPEEFAVMRTHAQLGADILAGSDHDLLKLAEEIARTHHERWDGSGYPNGLAGEEIPLAGRICAICDVFDALTSDRPYKSAWDFDDAMAEIARGAGLHFDPELTAIFLSLKEEIRQVYHELKDPPAAGEGLSAAA